MQRNGLPEYRSKQCGRRNRLLPWRISGRHYRRHVLFIGYVASIIGFVIGWLAEMGYTLLHGKKGIVESIILGFAVIFGVLFGTIFSQSITLVKEGFEVGELPKLFSLLFQDSKYVMASLFDIILGLVFAALGAFSLIKGAGKKGSKTKVIDLE